MGSMCHCQRSRSEEHTSELQSLAYLVCRLLLEKKNKETSADRKMYHDTVHSIQLWTAHVRARATHKIALLCRQIHVLVCCLFFFFLMDAPPTEFSPLPLHAALPI